MPSSKADGTIDSKKLSVQQAKASLSQGKEESSNAKSKKEETDFHKSENKVSQKTLQKDQPEKNPSKENLPQKQTGNINDDSEMGTSDFIGLGKKGFSSLKEFASGASHQKPRDNPEPLDILDTEKKEREVPEADLVQRRFTPHHDERKKTGPEDENEETVSVFFFMNTI
ncbi:hypothetical protein O181_043627 [Austropuccinia psidii MF-1]|uniref:Uncharacterized protein n=1 Tax=Austropuccinia psidii MF-1 TaxID=1389203 RepID=A0A9Q3DQ69_9BASI|nr:hypothetical protein [Austropuccinia psidii MF-1]